MLGRRLSAYTAPMSELFRTAHVVVSRDPREPFVRLVRTAEPIRSPREVHDVADGLDRTVPRSERATMGMLTDVRNAPLRNDPGFEETIAPLVTALADGFGRHAVLVRTAVGKLQVARQSRGSKGTATQVFDDERDAVAHLTKVRSTR